MSTLWGLFFIILSIAWIFRVIERTLFHVALWQRKEYRWDRMFAHLSTKGGLWLLLHPSHLLGWVLVLFVVGVTIVEYALGYYRMGYHTGTRDILFQLLVIPPLFILAAGIASVVRILRHRLMRPQWTGKAVVLGATSPAFVIAIFLFFSFIGRLIIVIENLDRCAYALCLPFTRIAVDPSGEWISGGFPFAFFLLLILPIEIATLVSGVSMISRRFQRRTIRAASARIRDYPHLTVIGITGSYGKSSAKEFLAHILASKYPVIKTPKNHNSAIGIAQTILKEFPTRPHPSPLLVGEGAASSVPEASGQKPAAFFVAEIGAYTKGEITRVSRIINPTIGVITAVNEQHLALFGKTIEDVKQAKYELIEALPENGTAVFNLDNPHTRAMAEKTRKKTLTYAIERPADVRASAITVQPEKLSFSVTINAAGPHPNPLLTGEGARGEKQHMTANLAGALHVPNLLAAITVAHALGMTLPEIATAVQTITQLPKTMEVVHHASGALIIDDAYSANPDGVLAALDHLKLIPRKNKILVMMPMIELGSSENSAHRRVAERIAQVCDQVIWTKRDYFSIVQAIAARNGLAADRIQHIEHPQRILEALAPFLNADSAILLENRIPALVADTVRK